MQSNQQQLDGVGCDESAVAPTIPDAIRAWESLVQVASSVRCPSKRPDPQTYHEAVDPETIFELDEKQAGGTIETILVVPHACERCRALKQACSRARPACARCAKARLPCAPLKDGYQRLPRSRVARGRRMDQSGDAGSSRSPSCSEQEAREGRAKARRVVSGLKRSLSSESDDFPTRKKSNTKSRSRKRRSTVLLSDEIDAEFKLSTSGPSVSVPPTKVTAAERNTLTWTFVNHPRTRDGKLSREREQVDMMPPDTPVPRIWTNSIEGLSTIFPELTKTAVGFSWFQFETPILLLGTNYARGHWINSTKLSIDLLWDFRCNNSDLDSADVVDIGDPAQQHSHSSAVDTPGDALACEAEMMDCQPSCVPPTSGSLTADVTVSTSISGAEVLPHDVSQHEESNHDSCTRGGSAIHIETPDDMEFSPDTRPSESSSSTHASPHASPANAPPRIPFSKPDEVETLLYSHARYIPLLIWISKDSELVPCMLPPEYAYLCMGLFFVSDIHHTVTQHSVCPTTGSVQGRVCWSLTLQWAPGGEDALFNYDDGTSCDTAARLCATKELSNPWWVCPTDQVSQTDENPYCLGNLKMQIFSCIPLDFLADFHPSEAFPRGWFCRSCGIINIQQFFRHQICQSSACRSRCEEGVPRGKADPLSSFRGAYQSSTLVRPINRIPSGVFTELALWDDGMHSWNYSIKDGVTLCHVFTGNQEHLQEDATALLGTIQCEVLLRREDRLSPYFVHSTRLLHSSDGSETKVPEGTPDCVRMTYYTLCDLVHRYAEKDKPRFGEVRILAWVNSGSKKGGVLRASKSPVVIHCLGTEMVLNLTPKGGYKEVAAPLIAPDKGKERAKDVDETESLSPGPCGGHAGDVEQDSEPQSPSVPGHYRNKLPTNAGDVGEPAIATDMAGRYHGLNGSSIATSDVNRDPGTEAVCHEVAKVRQGGVHKKNKINKSKNRATGPEISMTLVHGDCAVLYGDDFECQIVRFGATILVIGFPEET